MRDAHGHVTGYNFSEYPVIVDTGSSNLAMAVASCKNCGVGATDLDVDMDETMCIEVVYGSGSWSGYRSEQVRVGFVEESTAGFGPVVTNTTLAGITSQSDFFMGGGYNGILGLAYPALAEPYSAEQCSSSSSSSGSSAVSMSPSGGGGGGGSSGATSTAGCLLYTSPSPRDS